MARSPSIFRQNDIKRAVRAVIQAGCVVSRVVVERTGNIIVTTAQAEPAGEAEKTEPLDEWMAKYARTTERH